jgi:SecD/SecF fusion protein
MKTKFSAAIPLILLGWLMLASLGCQSQYKGPRVAYTLVFDTQDYLMRLAGDRADSSLVAILGHMNDAAFQAAQDDLERFQQAVERHGDLRRVLRWFPSMEQDDRAPTAELWQELRQRWTAAIDRTFTVLTARLEQDRGYRAVAAEAQPKGRFTVELTKPDAAANPVQLLRDVAEVGFYETYSLAEIWPDWVGARGMVLADSTLGNPDLYALVHTDDLVAQQEFQVGTNNHSLIGAAELADTALINRILQTPSFGGRFPRDLRLCWAALPNADRDGMLELYAIRTDKGKPTIDGSSVRAAGITKNLNDEPCIAMSMNAEGASMWKDMTTENLQREIAIVIDGLVYSAPTVQTPIETGECWISGNLGEQYRLKMLAAMLNNGSYPARLMVLHEEQLSK